MTKTIKAAIGTLGLLALLAGCAAPAPSGVNDPFESTNRAWFDRNLALASVVSGDEATDESAVEGTAAPSSSPVRRVVGNFGANLGMPSVILNDMLQIRPDRAIENTARLLVNTTVGLGGLFDPASRMGLFGRRTDFGETLHRWGVAEGAYVVLPLYGPSTERDTAGLIVDSVIDPLRYVIPQPEYAWSSAARIAGRLAEAAEYSDLLDANVINTADPYAQARLLYLQTRRYHLGIEAEEEIIDPYADF